MSNNGSIICVDFDGTCTTHAFPQVGMDIGAVPVLRELVDNGNKLILFTMRSDGKDGDFLSQAVEWFKFHDIPLYGINVNPTQKFWTSSPKAYGHLFVDDAGLGMPLIMDEKLSERPFVDWGKTRQLLVDGGFILEN